MNFDNLESNTNEQLKKECRRRSLPTSGIKSELIKRLRQDMSKEEKRKEKTQKSSPKTKSVTPPPKPIENSNLEEEDDDEDELDEIDISTIDEIIGQHEKSSALEKVSLTNKSEPKPSPKATQKPQPKNEKPNKSETEPTQKLTSKETQKLDTTLTDSSNSNNKLNDTSKNSSTPPVSVPKLKTSNPMDASMKKERAERFGIRFNETTEDKKKLRAERFNIQVKETEEEKRKRRADRFGTFSDKHETMTRLGLPVKESNNGLQTTQQQQILEENEKKRKRAERFKTNQPTSETSGITVGSLGILSPEELERRKKRALRFSKIPSE